jgi:hypothetical protein
LFPGMLLRRFLQRSKANQQKNKIPHRADIFDICFTRINRRPLTFCRV